MQIAVLDDYQGVALALGEWTALGADVTFFRDTVTGDALIERLEPFDAVCLMRERTPFPAALIDALPRLKLIVTAGPRNLSIDLEAARARGITVCGTGSRATATAQHAMTLILAASRGLVAEALSMREGDWQRGLGRDLDGLTLGLVGLGRLGAQLAALARPFGLDIIAWSANLTQERCDEVGVRRAESLDALLETADIVSVHLVLSDRTAGLIGAAQIDRMKPDAILVNTSRGAIVDARAALDALRHDRLGVAALDVFEEEPLPESHALRDRKLIDSGRLILTPHIGYVSRQTYELFYSEMVEDVAAWMNGTPVRVIA